MAKPKIFSVSTKATADQLARYQAAAGAQPLSEWVRDTLDRSLEREAVEERLDRIERFLLNVGADLSANVPITRERVRQYRESVPGNGGNGTADEPKWWHESNRVPMFKHQIPVAKRDGTT